MDKWFYAQPGQAMRGPVTLRELRDMVAQEELLSDDVVWREGSPNWLPVAKTPELQRSDIPPPKSKSDDKETTSGGFLDGLHRLPKPVLFGLYGALGGLLGALLLGELFWLLIRPAAAQVEPLRIAAAPTVTAYLGGENSLTVKLARAGFEGPISLRVLDNPRDIHIDAPSIAAEASEGELRLKVPDHAVPGSHQLQILAQSVDDDTISARTVVRLNVAPPPPTLFLAASSTVKVFVGDRNRCTVRITRQRFTGPVRIEAVSVPANVKVEPLFLRDQEEEGQMEIVLDPKAAVGEHTIELLGRSLENKEVQTKTSVQLIVEAVPPSLKIACSPSMVVYPGQSNRLGVKIARHHFSGPVSVTVSDLPPAAATAATLTIPADRTDGEVVVDALPGALPDGRPRSVDIRLRAKAAKVESETTFQLRIEPIPPALQFAVSPEVPVYAGEAARFAVKIARERFTGPVRVHVIGAPIHISIPPTLIAADRSEADLTVSVAKEMLAMSLPTKVRLTLRAESLSSPYVFAESNTFLEVTAPPSDLRLTASQEVEVFQGGRCRFTLKAARAGFLGPVRFSFQDVPGGVLVPDGEIPSDKDEIEWEGDATFDAEVKKHVVKVTGVGAKAADGKTPMTFASLSLDVKKGDPKRKPPPLDIIFVLDISGSMTPQINGVRDGIVKFVEELKKSRLQSRIGLVAFRGGSARIGKAPFGKTGGDYLKVMQFGGKPFTTDFESFRAEAGLLRAGGGGGAGENSLEAMVQSSRQPFLSNSLRILILITDEPPLPKGISMDASIEALRKDNISQVHLVTRKRDFDLYYKKLQGTTKGAFFEINEASKGKGGFAALLPVLSKEIVRISVAGGAETPVGKAPPALPPTKEAPKLSAALPPKAPKSDSAPTPPKVGLPPAPPAEAVANPRVPPLPPPPLADRVALPPRAESPVLRSVQSTQAFDEKDHFQLMLAIAVWTAVIAAVIGLALVCGQSLYLKKGLPSLDAVGKVLAAGAAAGLLGGALGQLFFQATAGGAAWNLITRSAAWTLLGGMLGAGIGLFVPNLKWHRGLLGGSLGGFIGALGFALFSLLGSVLGRWIGAALLGFCLGLMIALAELAFRRFWLQITFGAREVRTVTLGATPITIGSDERRASVFVSGVPSQALAYRLEGDQVICEDLGSGKRVIVSPGEERVLGAARIVVCSPATSAGAGIQLRLADGRTLDLSDGLPLTPEDLPGLQPQCNDGMVALVSRRPSQPNVLLLRNRSKQPWRVVHANGKKTIVAPGLGMDLSDACRIEFGALKATLVVEK